MRLPPLLSFILLAFTASAAEPSRAVIEPFLRDYCLRCHNAEKKKGDLRLDTLSTDFNDLLVAQTWDEVMLRLMLRPSHLVSASSALVSDKDCGRVV